MTCDDHHGTNAANITRFIRVLSCHVWSIMARKIVIFAQHVIFIFASYISSPKSFVENR